MTPAPTPAGGPDDLARPVSTTIGGKVLLGCVLVPVLFFFVVGVFGVLMCGLFAVLGEGGPWKGMPIAARVAVLVVMLLMALFFARVARGLIASMRGREVPHLLPPWLTVVLAVVMGLAFIATGIATIAGGKGGAWRGVGTSIGMGIAFIGYAINAVRAAAAGPPRRSE